MSSEVIASTGRWSASYLFRNTVVSVGGRETCWCVWPPQLNLRDWQAGKSNVFPLHCFARFGFNTCTSQAIPKEERGHLRLKPEISSCSCAAFRVGTTGFGTSCVLQVAGLMWPLSWTEPQLESVGLSWLGMGSERLEWML